MRRLFSHLGGNFVILAALLLCGGGHAGNATAAEPVKRALVISNSRYEASPLKNPGADADLIARALKATGFGVDRRSELNRSGLYAAVRDFSASLPDGAIALVYYAGHGMQINGSNYLIPVDMLPTSESGVASRAFAASAMIEKLHGSRAGVSIVVLDACRNNPFRPPSSQLNRNFDNLGLAKIVSPRGMVIAYSTAPGQLAEDGSRGGNSLYTEALAGEVQKPGQTIEQVLKNVGEAVRRKTYEEQQPWFESSLIDDYYFLPPNGVEIAANTVRRQAPAMPGPSRGVSAANQSGDSSPRDLLTAAGPFSGYEIVLSGGRGDLRTIEAFVSQNKRLNSKELGAFYVELIAEQPPEAKRIIEVLSGAGMGPQRVQTDAAASGRLGTSMFQDFSDICTRAARIVGDRTPGTYIARNLKLTPLGIAALYGNHQLDSDLVSFGASSGDESEIVECSRIAALGRPDSLEPPDFTPRKVTFRISAVQLAAAMKN